MGLLTLTNAKPWGWLGSSSKRKILGRMLDEQKLDEAANYLRRHPKFAAQSSTQLLMDSKNYAWDPEAYNGEGELYVPQWGCEFGGGRAYYPARTIAVGRAVSEASE